MAKNHDLSLLEDFFRKFNFSIRSTSLYSADHPSFKKTVTALIEALNGIKIQYPHIFFAVLPNGIIFEEELLTEQQSPLYRDMADFFHKRKIESLDLDIAAIQQKELEEFIALVAQQNTDDLKNQIAQKQFRAIKIALLDYSELLKKEGEDGIASPTQDAWEDRLKRLFTEKKTDEFRKTAETIIKQPTLDKNTSDALKAMEQIFNQQEIANNPFMKELISTVEQTAKSTSVNINKDAVTAFNKIIMQHGSIENISQLLASVLSNRNKTQPGAELTEIANSVLDNRKQEDIARATANILKMQGILVKRPELQESLHQAVLNNPTNQFANTMYKYTMHYLTEIKDQGTLQQLQQYPRMLESGILKQCYQNIMFDLLRQGARDKMLHSEEQTRVIDQLKKLFTKDIQEENLSGIFATLAVLDTEIPDRFLYAGILQELVRFLEQKAEYLLSEHLQTLVQFKVLIVMLIEEYLPQKIPFICSQYFEDPNATTKELLKQFIVLFKHAVAYDYLADRAKNLALEALADLIKLLAQMNPEKSVEALVRIYENSSTAMVKKAIIREMNSYPHLKNKKFLLSLVSENKKEPVLLKEIILTLLKENDQFINHTIASILFERVPAGDVLFAKKDFIDLVSIAVDLHFKESIPHLKNILAKNALGLIFFSTSKTFVNTALKTLME